MNEPPNSRDSTPEPYAKFEQKGSLYNVVSLYTGRQRWILRQRQVTFNSRAQALAQVTLCRVVVCSGERFDREQASDGERPLASHISTALGELWRDEVVPENVAKRVQVPKNAHVDDRERVVRTDAEFEAFMACPDVNAELHTMALVSRTLGGARTSDLHAWDWAHVDTVHWLDAHVPRPKRRAATA